MSLLSGFFNMLSNSVRSIQQGMLQRPFISMMITVVVILFVSWIYWFLTTYHRVSSSDYQMTERAKLNPYYASELLLNRRHQLLYDTDEVIARSDLDTDLSSLLGSVADLSDLSNVDSLLDATDGYVEDDYDSDYASDYDDEDDYSEDDYSYGDNIEDGDIEDTEDYLELDNKLNDELNDENLNNHASFHPTLVIRSVSDKLTEEKYQKLMQWVESGGHIITFATSNANDEDWEMVESRLDELQADNATAEQIRNDKELQQALEEMSSYSDNMLLNRLGIFKIYDYAEYGRDIDEVDAEYEAFQDYLDELGLELSDEDDEEDAKNDNENSDKNDNQNDEETEGDENQSQEQDKNTDQAVTKDAAKDEVEPATHATQLTKEAKEKAQKEIERIRRIRSFINTLNNFKPATIVSTSRKIVNAQDQHTQSNDVHNHDQNADAETLMMFNIGDANDGLNKRLYQALHPNSQPYQQFKPVDVIQIRGYLQQQLKLLKQQQSDIKQELAKQNNARDNEKKSQELVDATDNVVQDDETDETTSSPTDDPSDDELTNGKDESLNQNKILVEDMQLQIEKLTWLLKLDDKHLQNMFAPLDWLIFDNHYGSGRITVLATDDMWQNPSIYSIIDNDDNIDKNINIIHDLGYNYPSLYTSDNAKLLTAITADSRAIWFLSKTDIEVLPVILWKNARLAVLGLMLLAILWLWSLYNRFGKPQYLDDGQAHDIFRYFHQIGRYGWGYDRAKKLSKLTRTQTEQSIKKALGFPANKQITPDILPNLSQMLQTRFEEKLSAYQAHQPSQMSLKAESHRQSQALLHKRRHERLYAYLTHNHQHLKALLTAEGLSSALLPTNQVLAELTPQRFAEHTQTLWLIKWLLD